MENKELKELIIQKKESYQGIIDETKKKNADKTVITGISLAALVAGFGGIIAPVSVPMFIASFIATGAGAYGTFSNVPRYVKNLYIRFKSKLAQRKLNKALDVVNSIEEEQKTKEQPKQKTKTK